MKGHFASGTVEGTGASINTSIGFVPAYVRIINIDGDAIMEWTEDMDDGTAFKQIADGTGALVATLGVTPYAGVAAGAGKGFVIGADTDVNVSAETIMWIAMGEVDA